MYVGCLRCGKWFLWSYETKIELFDQSSKCYMWRKSNTATASRSTTPTVKYGSGNIMQWGHFPSAGPGKRFRIEGKVIGNRFCTISQENLL